ncbi:MAG: TIGR04086 family membrane protein [Christensenellales bacterium]
MEGVLDKKANILGVLKGVLVAVCVSIVGVLLFAVVYKFVPMNGTTIKIVNQVIKVLSVVLGVNVALKGNKTKGAVKGILIGAIYSIVAYAIFGLLSSTFTFNLSILYDVIFAGLVGLIAGIFLVNLKK